MPADSETDRYIFEQKIVRKICGYVKEENWRIRTNKEIKNT